MRREFWHTKWTAIVAAGLAFIAVISLAGAVQGSGDNGDNGNGGNGDGHTPVTICHWVPAHGGSYVVITIDDDGLHGHGDHENDIIPATAECMGDDKTEVPKTRTVVVSPTVGAATNTPGAATNTPVATNTPGGLASPTSDVPGGGPDLTPSATNTTEAVDTATSTPEGDVGADTATPAATDTPVVGAAAADTVVPGGEGGVLGVQSQPAEDLPAAGDGSSTGASTDYALGLAALAIAGTALGGMMLIKRRMS